MSDTLISDLRRELAAERDHGKRLQQQIDAILHTDKPKHEMYQAALQAFPKLGSMETAARVVDAALTATAHAPSEANKPSDEEIEDLALRLEIDYRQHRYQNCQRAASMLRRCKRDSVSHDEGDKP